MHASPSKKRTAFPSRDSLTYVPRPLAIRRCSCTAIRATQGKTQIAPTFSDCSRTSRRTRSASSMSIGSTASRVPLLTSVSFGTVLQAHNVEFVSVTENFDTSTPMGRAMLHIIMVFAQLERETTAERVKDNYDSRAALGRGPVDLLLTAIATDGQARGVLHWSRTWSSWRLSAVYLRSTPKRALPSKALPIC